MPPSSLDPVSPLGPCSVPSNSDSVATVGVDPSEAAGVGDGVGLKVGSYVGLSVGSTISTDVEVLSLHTDGA